MDGIAIKTRDLPLDLRGPSATSPRKTFDEDSLRGLGTFLATVGQIHPRLVRPVGERFELVAGERRWREGATDDDVAHASGRHRAVLVTRLPGSAQARCFRRAVAEMFTDWDVEPPDA